MSSTLVGQHALDPLFASAWKGEGAVVVRDSVSRVGKKLFKSLVSRALEKLPSGRGQRGLAGVCTVVVCAEQTVDDQVEEWARRGLKRVAFVDASSPSLLPSFLPAKGEEEEGEGTEGRTGPLLRERVVKQKRREGQFDVFTPPTLSPSGLQLAIDVALSSLDESGGGGGGGEGQQQTSMVVVDSISLLLHLYAPAVHASVSVIGSVVGSSLKKTGFSHSSLFMLAHTDDMPTSTSRVLDSISTSSLSFEKRDVIMLRHRRSNGKVVEKLLRINMDASNVLADVKAIASEERANIEAEAEKEANELAHLLGGGVSFSLSLSAEEKAARSAVVLPHMFHLNAEEEEKGGQGGGGKQQGSVYISDSDEEIDDEDLDEDLDV
mmetsp:Transcript_21818/g.56685  ORF Transcript_21818/g.56685 Transcript_21818/m.56685 type:complete len:379 (-) Transcript_21818:171-1307(-)